MLILVSAKHYSIVALENRAKTTITLIDSRHIAIKYNWRVKIEGRKSSYRKNAVSRSISFDSIIKHWLLKGHKVHL